MNIQFTRQKTTAVNTSVQPEGTDLTVCLFNAINLYLHLNELKKLNLDFVGIINLLNVTVCSLWIILQLQHVIHCNSRFIAQQY